MKDSTGTNDPRPEPPSLFTESVRELVAIGAAIASNCEPCFRFHYDKARKLGVSPEDMLKAVDVGKMVKDASAANVLDVANKHLHRASSNPACQEEGTCGCT